MNRRFLSAMLAAAWLGGAAFAGEPPTAPAEAEIPFANSGGIRAWFVENDANLLLEDRQGQWYRARLLSPAYYLAYAEALRFATGPSGTLQKLDSVIVRGQFFPIVSLTRIELPAKAVRK